MEAQQKRRARANTARRRPERSATNGAGAGLGGGDPAGQGELEDARVRWMLAVVEDYFRSHAVDTLRGSASSLKRLRAFLDTDAVKTVYVVEVGTRLALSDTPPPPSPQQEGGERVLYFTKLVEQRVSEQQFSQQVLVGDCAVDPVQQLEQVTQEVFLPLLCNARNQKHWSEIVRKDVMDSINGFMSHVQITTGLMRGETFLPLPDTGMLSDDEEDSGQPGAGGGEHDPHAGEQDPSGAGPSNGDLAERRKKAGGLLAAAARGGGNGGSLLTASAPALSTMPMLDEAGTQVVQQKERVHVFEGCLITWTKQIKNVLRMDPETKLKQGLNPGPLEEVDFWRVKAANLNSIFEQLQSPRVRKVLRFLDANKSTYNQPFAKLCKESFDARDEANSNSAFLQPLVPWFQKLEGSGRGEDMDKACQLFKPIMHVVLLVWKASKYYNSIPRLVVIMREIANAVVNLCTAYLNGPRLFAMLEAEEHTKAHDMIKCILRVIGSFKSTYFDYKARANAECVSNPWRVQNNALFVRLDAFLERCHDLLDLTQTISHFSKLNRIEIGGTKGKTLTTSVHQVYQDFENSVQAIKEVPYDVMDVDAKHFDDDFYEFRVKAKELERRLASVLAQGFEDCPTITGRFKLLDSFDQILDRPIIQDELESKHLALLLSYSQDLAFVQQLFSEQRADPPVAANLPPIAGAVSWGRGLLDRISAPMAKLREFNTPILEREGARDVIKTYTTLVAGLSEFENGKIRAWEESIEASSISKLKLPLLRRSDDTNQLAVNFDPALVQLLREVKYFLLLGLKVPPNALAIYEKVEEFRRETGNLELIVQKYNKIKATLLPVEKPLIRNHLNKIDKVINQGLKTLTWKSHGIESFITEATSAVQEADDIVSTMKEGLAHIEELMDRWAESSMIVRMAKSVPVDEFNLNSKRELLNRLQLVTNGGKEIHKLLKEIVKKLKVSAGLPDWKAYVDFVNNIVIAGLCNTVEVSLNYVLREIDLEVIENEAKLPLLEVDLILSSRMVLFSPVLEESSKGDGIRDEVAQWIESIYSVGALFKRLDSPSGTYLKEIVQCPSVMSIVGAIHCNLDATMVLADELRNQYRDYEYLWTTDLNAMFAEFLKTAFLPPEKCEEDGMAHDEGEDGEGSAAEDDMSEDNDSQAPGISEEEDSRPNLKLFDERINHFQALRVKIAELPASRNVGFLRVNTQPIKQALSTWVTKWVYLFTQFLHDYVVRHLSGLNQFVTEVGEGLKFDLESEAFDDDALMGVMRHIRNVRKRMLSTQRMFEPLGDIMHLLRRHNISFDTDHVGGVPIATFFDQAPELWDSTVNMAFKAREGIQARQNSMAAKVKAQASAFELRLREFRNEFLAKAPFGQNASVLGNPDAAYETMQQYYEQLTVLQEEANALRELEDLFELQQSPATELSDIALELEQLKKVWDMYSSVSFAFDSWSETLWEKIDTAFLDDEVQRLMRQMEAVLPPAVHGWAVFDQLERRMRNMGTVIPLVHELHSPAMRERHWKQIMSVTSCQFEKNARFCLQNVMDLGLHNYVDQVTEIVEVANKELKIDQKLKAIEDVWVSLELQYVPHKPSTPDCKVIVASEAVIEALEEHQLQLQTLAGLGKFVEFFRERVVNWQKTLGAIETTLLLWLRVQQTWASLETIFLSSSDIRAELPRDTERFQVLDQTFKEIMAESSQAPNAMASCCHAGRLEMLREMWGTLEVCQKALNEYLDQKKNLFPRFYFVSNRALLDILSNGNEPLKIMPHLESCFHGIKTLDFVQPEEVADAPPGEADEAAAGQRKPAKKGKKGRKRKAEGEDGETAIAMVSGDGERVDFPSPFRITGAVERWLNEMTDVMHHTLKHETSQALAKTASWDGDRPREAWVFDFPAQVVLLASKVVWTDELRLAIEELEGGSEGTLERFMETCGKRLRALIKLVQGKLTKGNRTKIISLITLDVHGKEVVERLVERKVESTDDFAWQAQLRYYWSDENESCDARIADFNTKYSFEYVGNCDRLVITPLTDRCYITLTMALRLTLGGAPAGPAGTGKTETTKDLARSLGLPCYVFNCSDQMNYRTIGDIFKGLAQTGAWGCFDEFNRIPIEVLSVVATQVKTILDATRHLSDVANRAEEYMDAPAGKPPCCVGTFDFMGTIIALVPTTGFFITMNPGYAGRTELPENLKAHFRSCAMIRPDLKPICQNMLMAEGFVEARALSVKFVTLYRLSSELLSQQPHYDWGLRNVKSVLRVAGILRRAQPEVEEAPILMRALRDFNITKLPSFDLPIFLRLVNDLFPNVNIQARFDEDLKRRAIKACSPAVPEGEGKGDSEGDSEEAVGAAETKRESSVLQPEEAFLNKVVNLQEIMDVRHSVMLLGPPGCGKTSIWKTLARAHNVDDVRPRCVTEVLNPKAITSNELYGFMNLQKDWKDGALSIVMRNMSSTQPPYHASQRHHWIVLDGDIDAIWIESMNTVMDDNKVLTLVSNERIQLTSKMRLIFEISTLKNATPATVSRAGILYINEEDVGWAPLVDSWVQSATNSELERAQLPLLFKKYLKPTIELIQQLGLAHIVPREPIAHAQSVCSILETLLDRCEPHQVDKEVLENLFVFALVWGVAGSLAGEKNTDGRRKFSQAFLSAFKTVQFYDPEGIPVPGAASADQGIGGGSAAAAVAVDAEGKACGGSGSTSVFDFYYDVEARQMVPWKAKLAEAVQFTDTQHFSEMIVPTVDSVRLSFLLGALVRKERPVALIGSAGTGKTTTIKEFLRAISGDRASAMINMNYYTDSYALQQQLEQHVDKRSGKIYGPSGDKKLIYFVDDLNMPYVEEYGTQSPIALIRQFMDYHQWYDRGDLGLKRDIQDVQFVAAMNHKCGSFTINPRLQRHFTVLACQVPDTHNLQLIYRSIIASHLDNFAAPVQALGPRLVDAAVELHGVMNAKFLPSAVKFHYIFNMRDISAVFQGLLRSTSERFATPLSLARLFVHECRRVFSDRLISEKDEANFDSILQGISKKYFEEEPEEIFAPPLIFTGFITSSGTSDLLAVSEAPAEDGPADGGAGAGAGNAAGGAGQRRGGGKASAYCCARSFDEVQSSLEGHLAAYNQQKAKMELVLFTLAAEHVCRIARIIGNPGGNALLVGVGGSGKQSLSRLAAFICKYDVMQIEVSGDYTIADFKESLKGLYRRAGLRPHLPVVLLLTDAQIVEERFLVYINDVLSSGYVPDLFTADEYDGLFASLRSEAKAKGVPSSRSHMMDFFIGRVRSALHIVLCHSPVGDSLRVRARKFPGLTNCTSIDWFHPWPREALVAVAGKFLAGIDLGSSDVAENVMHHIAEVHLSVTDMSQKYWESQRRHNYVTPKSFLELVSYYKRLLGEKRTDRRMALERLRAGLDTLRSTASDVAILQQDLKETMVKVEERKLATEELLEQMGQQRGEAQAQQTVASKERIRAEKFAREAEEIEADAETELAAAQPAMDQAEEAVNCLTKASLTELKSLTKPPAGVDKVTTCVLMMIKNEKRNFSWDNAKRMMGNIDKFKQSLEEYDSKNIPEELIERTSAIVNDPEFTFEKLSKKSAAAANMASWVLNILEFNKIYKKVKPLMERLDAARLSKEEAMGDLARVEDQLKDAEDRLNELQENFMHATNEKSKVEADAAVCNERLQLAERLVNGLASENERWEKEIESLEYQMETLVGDTLLASSFVSYSGAFDAGTRRVLWEDIWTNDMLSREIPLSEGITPLKIITTDAEVAHWSVEGLPSDPFSVENGAILTSCTRWPLVIDPQLQGLAWLRSHFAPEESAEKSAGGARRKTRAELAREESQRGLGSDADDGKSVSGASIAPGAGATDGATSASGAMAPTPAALKRRKTARTVTAPEISSESLVVMQLSQKNWQATLVEAIEAGATVILENVGESFDPVLTPLLSRSFTFKGRQPYLMLGGSEVEFDPSFRLVLQTRLSNPHYQPEVVAQCTLINFIVTEAGLEEQLLARVVGMERAELEQQKQELQMAFNRYKIQLLDLENVLLEKLSNAPDDILSDVPMIESLEATKATATEVGLAVEKGKETEKGINEAREAYRPVAAEASMLYFLLLQLGSVNHMYQYSLASFMGFFDKSMRTAEQFSAAAASAATAARPGYASGGAEHLPSPSEAGGLGFDRDSAESAGAKLATEQRVQALRDSVRLTIYTMVSRGLFVTHKMIFLIQMTFNLLRKEIVALRHPDDRFDAEGLQFLLRAPQRFDMDNEIDWLPDARWQTVCALAEQEGFEQLPLDMIESAPRFKEWYNAVSPENEKLPLDWRELEKRPFLKILVVRALRPDRTLAALTSFVRQTLPKGHHYVECDSELNSYQVLARSFEDSSPETPIYFILSPGSDVVADVDMLARREGMVEGVTYRNISLGQGQDVVAVETLEEANRQGWWVFLNNVHLMPSWLSTLSKKLDEFAAGGNSHDKFRLFLSSDASPKIPVNILDRCIKLTNEPPAGLRANLTRSWAQFPPAEVDSVDNKTRSILFGLCYFHSVMLERKTYMTKGFNVQYPFSAQDLMACAVVLRNYMENHTGTKVPWEDLRYLFGEIMYGGHIVNDFDRRVCTTYLEYYMNDQLLDELEMFPFADGATVSSGDVGMGGNDGGDGDGGDGGDGGGAGGGGGGAGGGGSGGGSGGGAPGAGRAASFKCLALSSHEKYLELIHETLPGETPMAFGLHPNAELGFRTAANNLLFKTLQSLQKTADEEEGDGQSPQHIAEAMLQDMLDTYRDVQMDTDGVASSLDNPDPFQNMYLQECVRMQSLLREMVRSLEELELGFKGDLTMTEPMERLMDALFHDRVPEAWVRISYPTERPLGSWLSNLQTRITQLQDWMVDPMRMPRCTWISGFFNPNAFLTAILQTSARSLGVELDRMEVSTEVLKRRESDIDEPSREGAYITGLFIEGASWDFGGICIEEARPKETICAMPVIHCRAVVSSEFEPGAIYECPVYRTQMRGPTYVFSASLRTRAPAAKWVLAGVVLLMDPS